MPTTSGQDLADYVCALVRDIAGRQRPRMPAAWWVSLGELQATLDVDGNALETAARKAVERGRLKAAGEPVHSVALAWEAQGAPRAWDEWMG